MARDIKIVLGRSFHPDTFDGIDFEAMESLMGDDIEATMTAAANRYTNEINASGPATPVHPDDLAGLMINAAHFYLGHRLGEKMELGMAGEGVIPVEDRGEHFHHYMMNIAKMDEEHFDAILVTIQSEVDKIIRHRFNEARVQAELDPLSDGDLDCNIASIETDRPHEGHKKIKGPHFTKLHGGSGGDHPDAAASGTLGIDDEQLGKAVRQYYRAIERTKRDGFDPGRN